MMKLYAIDEAIQAILDEADPDTGELAPDALERLDGLELAREAKADHIARLVMTYAAEGDAIAGEAERLRKLAACRRNHADQLKRYLLRCLVGAGIQRLNTDLFSFSVCRNSAPSIRVADGHDIPAECQRVQITLDARKVQELIRAGWDVPDSIEVEYGTHLRIR
jgi:hypothetical protein